jgi:murein DD-endopeptidase MepM/ murein hydrolase activator NlpD
LSGNSGSSTGAHLHYEVLYKNVQVNPANYYDLSMTPEEYMTMIRPYEEEE